MKEKREGIPGYNEGCKISHYTSYNCWLSCYTVYSIYTIYSIQYTYTKWLYIVGVYYIFRGK